MVKYANVVCWVSMVDRDQKKIHMAFDTIESDYDILYRVTADREKKRLSKTGFVISAKSDAICDELDSYAGKKIKIKVKCVPYKFTIDANIISGYTFVYDGVINS